MQIRTKFCYDIMCGMAYLHKNNNKSSGHEKIEFIHGDLKADNVFLDANLSCLVGDFGLSSIKLATSAASLRRSGAVRWIAPERYKRGYKQMASIDVFAAAMTCYQLLTGKIPFHEEMDDEIVKQWIRDGERPEWPPSCDVYDSVKAVIEDCWNQEAENRPTFEVARNRLRSWITSKECSTGPKLEQGLELSAKQQYSSEFEGKSGQELLSLGIRLDKNSEYKAALHRFQEAWKLGIIEASFWIGLYYEKGLAVSTGYKKAIEWYEKAASRGYPQAQFNLGNLFYTGSGILQDFKVAKEWYEKSATQGHAAAQFSLGSMYADGLGVPQSPNLAKEWYILSATQGYPAAQFKLGVWYQNGVGVEKSYKTA